jgi:hypothetical protein
MRLSLSLAAAFTCCFFIGFGQQNLQPGYIILNDGDTLRGFIDYKEWHKNPSEISFGIALDKPTSSYSTDEITYFEVIGKESYYRFRVRVSMDTRSLSYLAEKKDSSSRTENEFLRTVSSGKNISLFSLNDEVKLRWYVKHKNDLEPQELLNSMYRTAGQVVNEREYRVQLYRIASSYSPTSEEMTRIISRTNYTEQSIRKICDLINGDNQNEAVEKKNRDKSASRVRFFAGTGLTRGVITFSRESRYTGQQPSVTLTPLLTGGVDIYLVPEIGRAYFRNSLTYTKIDSEVKSEVEVYYQATEQYILELSQQNISIHSQLNYNFYNKPGFKWFGGVGAGINIPYYSKNRQTYIAEGVGATTHVTDNYLATKKFWLNTSFRSGIAIKHVELAMSYYPKSDITSSDGYSVKNSSWQLQCIYLF